MPSQHLRDNTHLPAHFFPTHSTFELDIDIQGTGILDIFSAVDERLVKYFIRHPDHLYSLSPAQFEELIAELFDGFGFNVKVTGRTRNGGRDIIAVKHHVVATRYLIECKRYAAHRPVGLSVVQRLHGVAESEDATKRILATTSRFTRPAKQHFVKHQWRLEGRVFNGLLDWLNEYQKLQMAKLLGLPVEKYLF